MQQLKYRKKMDHCSAVHDSIETVELGVEEHVVDVLLGMEEHV